MTLPEIKSENLVNKLYRFQFKEYTKSNMQIIKHGISYKRTITLLLSPHCYYNISGPFVVLSGPGISLVIKIW